MELKTVQLSIKKDGVLQDVGILLAEPDVDELRDRVDNLNEETEQLINKFSAIKSVTVLSDGLRFEV